MFQAHLFISGFVQGVGYRQFVKSHAKKLDLKGWVHNLPDGRVEAVIQGEKKIIEELIQLCKKGTFLSEVENVEVEWEEKASFFHDFVVQTT
jgi:acylphosphatase